MTESELIALARERGATVGPSAAEMLAKFNDKDQLALESEKSFMARVIELAKSLEWLAYHTHYSIKCEPGFPDLVLVRDRVIFTELKAEYGKQTKAQREWERRLRDAGALFYLWRPSDWAEIVRVLTPSTGR